MDKITGYLHQNYAYSLNEFGQPRELPRCGGWVLERQIPGFTDRDAMGIYPLFVCKNWSQLHKDLKDIETELVSLSVVTDPFGEYDRVLLNNCFEHVVPFKDHFIVDLNQHMDNYVATNHRRNALKSLRMLTVERCERPGDFIDEWVDLYEELILKHSIKGITAFSKESFAKQLSVPGLVMFRAVYENMGAGFLLWYIQGDAAYYHLGCSSPRGYELNASHALMSFSIKYFTEEGLRWLELGAGAGLIRNDSDGLSQFKRGWSTDSRTVYFCGRIFDPRRYAEIVQVKNITANDYFPAYRKGEFT